MTTITNIDGKIIFKGEITSQDFVEFANKIAMENEDGNIMISDPATALDYIQTYCQDLNIL